MRSDHSLLLRTYVIKGGILQKRESRPVEGGTVFRMIMGSMKSWLTHRVEIGLKGAMVGRLGVSAGFQWSDGKVFFQASTASIRKLL